MQSIVIYSIAVASPGCAPLSPLPVIPRTPPGHCRGPRSRTAALHQLHASPADGGAADPRLGAVVVATHSKEWTVGQVVDVTLQVEQKSTEP